MENIDLKNYYYILFKPFNKIYKVNKGEKLSVSTGTDEDYQLSFLAELQADMIFNINPMGSTSQYRLEKTENQVIFYFRRIFPYFYFQSKYNPDIVTHCFSNEIKMVLEDNYDIVFNELLNVANYEIILDSTFEHDLRKFNAVFDNIFEKGKDYNNNDTLLFSRDHVYFDRNEIESCFQENLERNQLIDRKQLVQFLYEMDRQLLTELEEIKGYLGLQFYSSNDYLFEFSHRIDNMLNIQNLKNIRPNGSKLIKVDKFHFIDMDDERYFKIIEDEKDIKNYLINENFK